MHEGSGCGILGSTTVSLERFVVWVYLGSGGELWGERRYPWAAVPEILDIRYKERDFLLFSFVQDDT